MFGADVVEQFLDKHDLDLFVRAHQVVEDGYEFFSGRRLVTIFSAPLYCGEFDNAAAVMTIDEKLCCSFKVRDRWCCIVCDVVSLLLLQVLTTRKQPGRF